MRRVKKTVIRSVRVTRDLSVRQELLEHCIKIRAKLHTEQQKYLGRISREQYNTSHEYSWLLREAKSRDTAAKKWSRWIGFLNRVTE